MTFPQQILQLRLNNTTLRLNGANWTVSPPEPGLETNFYGRSKASRRPEQSLEAFWLRWLNSQERARVKKLKGEPRREPGGKCKANGRKLGKRRKPEPLIPVHGGDLEGETMNEFLPHREVLVGSSVQQT